MSITLNLASETEKLLQTQAARNGQSIEDFVRHLVEKELGTSTSCTGDLSTPEEPWQKQLREELREEIALGLEQIAAGQIAPFDPVESLAQIRQRRAQAVESK